MVFQEQLVYPKIAQNKDEKWLYVINQDSYLQGIRIEKCAWVYCQLCVFPYVFVPLNIADFIPHQYLASFPSFISSTCVHYLHESPKTVCPYLGLTGTLISICDRERYASGCENKNIYLSTMTCGILVYPDLEAKSSSNVQCYTMYLSARPTLGSGFIITET